MASVCTIQRTGGTLADLREFLAEADRAGLPGSARVHVKTGFSLSPLGPALKSLGASSEGGK